MDDISLTDFVRMLRGETPVRNNTMSRAMDMMFGSTQEFKRLAAAGDYEQLEAMEMYRRSLFDEWLGHAKSNRKHLENHQSPIPDKARAAVAE